MILSMSYRGAGQFQNFFFRFRNLAIHPSEYFFSQKHYIGKTEGGPVYIHGLFQNFIFLPYGQY